MRCPCQMGVKEDKKPASHWATCSRPSEPETPLSFMAQSGSRQKLSFMLGYWRGEQGRGAFHQHRGNQLSPFSCWWSVMVTQAKILPPLPVSPHPIWGCNGDGLQAFVPASNILSSELYPLSSIVFSVPETVSRERITLTRWANLEKPSEPIDLNPQRRYFSGHSLYDSQQSLIFQ